MYNFLWFSIKIKGFQFKHKDFQKRNFGRLKFGKRTDLQIKWRFFDFDFLWFGRNFVTNKLRDITS